MDYDKQIPFEGDPTAAMHFAQQQLASRDYRVSPEGGHALTGTYRGFMMKGRPPMVGASEIHFRAEAGRLRLSADFGNLRRTLRLFLLIFPVGFTALFTIVMLVVPGMPGVSFALAIGLPMVMVLPMIWAISRPQLIKDLDTLLANVAEAGDARAVHVPRSAPALSTGAYLLLGVACVGGAVAMGALMTMTLFDMGQALARVAVPGTGEFTLEHAGQYTIFHEYRGEIDGEPYEGPRDLRQLTLSLAHVERGEAVPLQPAEVRSRYSYGTHAGYSAFQFSIDGSGVYRLTGEPAPGAGDVPRAVLAINAWDTERVFSGFAVQQTVLLACIFGSITCFVLAWHAWQARRAG